MRRSLVHITPASQLRYRMWPRGHIIVPKTAFEKLSDGTGYESELLLPPLRIGRRIMMGKREEGIHRGLAVVIAEKMDHWEDGSK